MKRTLYLFSLSFAVMLGLSMAAFAQNTQATIKFTGVLGTNNGQFYTGIYYGTLNGTPNTQFICDDATHEISEGDTWIANVWTLSQVVQQNNGAFAGVNNGSDKSWEQIATYANGTTGHTYTVAQVYDAVAWLAVQIFTQPTSPNVNDIQYAIWQLMDDPAGSSPNSGAWITAALKATANGYSNPYILFYSPDGNLITSGPDSPKGTAQEFMGYQTPEPLSMALMGTFLTLAGLGLGRKKLFS
jgi:hypothetical protein